MFKIDTVFSQRDPAWANLVLGTNTTLTMGVYGCLVADLAMLIKAFGGDETPATVNNKMVAAGQYTGSDIIPARIPRVFPYMVFIDFIRCETVPAPMDRINAALANNKPVIVEVDSSPSPGLQRHWVIIYDRIGTDYLIVDPYSWPMDTEPVLLTARYGGTPAQVITGVIFMDGNIVPVPPPQPFHVIPEKKGVFLWQLPNAFGGDMTALADTLIKDSYSWIAVKASDGTVEYNTRLMPTAIREFRRVGLGVVGWQYCYGYYPVTEGNIAVTNIQEHGFDSWLIDAESEYEKTDALHSASRYMDILRASYPDLPIGLCSFRYPSVHQAFPWATFLSRCDFHCPQVYWVGAHNPGDQLQRSVNELQALRNLPVIPVGAAYYEDGWQPTVAELGLFYTMVRQLNLKGYCWWSWDSAGIQDNPAFRAAIAAQHWDPPAPPPTVTLLEWAKGVDKELRAKGIYDGPQPG